MAGEAAATAQRQAKSRDILIAQIPSRKMLAFSTSPQGEVISYSPGMGLMRGDTRTNSAISSKSSAIALIDSEP